MKKTICSVCKKKIPVSSKICPKCSSPLKIEIPSPDYKEKIEKKELYVPQAYKKGDKLRDYRIVQILGGGMGRIYVCVDETKNEIYALKTFKEELFSSEEIKNSFIKEVLTWINLGDHQNIVRCYAPFDYLDQLFIVVEYISPDLRWGNTLTDFIKKFSPLTLHQSLIFAIQFCDGMEYAISKGILCHRDIKPDNIMISREGVVKITDFGLVKAFDFIKNVKQFKKFSSNSNIQNFGFLDVTEDNAIVGTPPWMAPEQFEGKADIKSDIYSFGVVLFQMVNRGKLPFLAQTVERFYYAHKTLKIPKCKSKLFPIIKKCLQKDPSKRYKTFKDLRKDLIQLYEEEFDEWTLNVKPREEKKKVKYVNTGMVLSKVGKYDEAILEFEKALEIDPNIPQVYHNLGIIYREKKQYDKAIYNYKKALQIKPDFISSIYSLGNVFSDKGDLEKAIQEYKRAISIQPNHFGAHINLGNLLEHKGLFEEAIRLYIEALKINPKYVKLLFILGHCYLKLKQWDKAREVFHKFINDPPPNMTNEVKDAVNMLKFLGN